MFTDGTSVLAGYHPKKRYITGLGGKARKGELCLDTAFRETLEELFHFAKYPECLLEEIIRSIGPPSKVFQTDGYTNHIYSFDDLKYMLDILGMFKLTSPLYSLFPRTIEELILTRNTTKHTEITHLVLLPVMKEIRVAKHFLKDLASLVETAAAKPSYKSRIYTSI